MSSFLNRKRWVAPLLVLSVVACATPQVQVTIKKPPRYSQVTQYERLAVLPFSGNAAEKAEGDLTAMLLAPKRENGSPYYRLLERKRIDAIIEEQGLQSSGVVDESTGISLGKLAGVQAVLSGDATVGGESEKYTGKHSQAYTDKEGNTRYRKVSVPCQNNIGTFDLSLRLVDVQSGSIIYARKYDSQHKSSACDRRVDGVTLAGAFVNALCGDACDGFATEVAVLQSRAQAEVIREVERDLTPYEVVQKVEYKTSSKGLSGQQKKLFEAALKAAKKGQMDYACGYWDRLYQLNAEHLDLLYNVAVCSEIKGDLRQALLLLESISKYRYDNLLEVDTTLEAGKKRISKAIKDQQALDDQAR